MSLRRKNRFSEATKDKIDPEIWDQAIQALQEGKGLYIFGKVGTGKTFLCHALSKTKAVPRIFSVPDILLRMKATFSNQGGLSENEKDIIDDLTGESTHGYYDNRPIILDDIGTEKPTEWAQQNLFLIIDRRYEAMRQTIFTSNLSLDELSERLGDRITSRIAEMCKVIELKGKDRRINK